MRKDKFASTVDEEAISDLSSRANNPDLSERLLA
jgi:hypothetical protein